MDHFINGATKMRKSMAKALYSSDPREALSFSIMLCCEFYYKNQADILP